MGIQAIWPNLPYMFPSGWLSWIPWALWKEWNVVLFANDMHPRPMGIIKTNGIVNFPQCHMLEICPRGNNKTSRPPVQMHGLAYFRWKYVIWTFSNICYMEYTLDTKRKLIFLVHFWLSARNNMRQRMMLLCGRKEYIFNKFLIRWYTCMHSVQILLH